MFKKSRVIAALLMSVMLFSVVQPAFAWGETQQQRNDAADWGFWGAVGGAALAICTGGLALIPMAGAAAVGAAAGAYYGGANEEEKAIVHNTAKDAALDYIQDKAVEKIDNYFQNKGNNN